MDHSPAAAPLKEAWNTRTYGFGPHGSGKAAEGVNIEAGGDMDFTPDITVKDGDVIEGNGGPLNVSTLPGIPQTICVLHCSRKKPYSLATM